MPSFGVPFLAPAHYATTTLLKMGRSLIFTHSTRGRYNEEIIREWRGGAICGGVHEGSADGHTSHKVNLFRRV